MHTKSLAIRTRIYGDSHLQVCVFITAIPITTGSPVIQRHRGCLPQSRSVRASVGVLSEIPRHYDQDFRPREPRCSQVIQLHRGCLPQPRSARASVKVPSERQVLSERFKYYQKGLDITVRLVGSNESSVSDSFHNIGNVYLSQGKSEEGLEMHIKSLDIKSRIYGDRHPCSWPTP